MKKMFKAISTAFVIGTARATEDLGLSRPVEPLKSEVKEQDVRESSMLNFAQRIAKIYGGEDFDTNAAAKAVANETEFAEGKAKCPSCAAILQLATLRTVDQCPCCAQWLRVAEFRTPRGTYIHRFVTTKKPTTTTK